MPFLLRLLLDTFKLPHNKIPIFGHKHGQVWKEILKEEKYFLVFAFMTGNIVAVMNGLIITRSLVETRTKEEGGVQRNSSEDTTRLHWRKSKTWVYSSVLKITFNWNQFKHRFYEIELKCVLKFTLKWFLTQVAYQRKSKTKFNLSP